MAEANLDATIEIDPMRANGRTRAGLLLEKENIVIMGLV